MPDYRNAAAGAGLQQLLQGLQPLNDYANEQAKQRNALALQKNKAELGKQEQETNIQTLKDLISNVKPGQKMNFKVGDVSGGETDENPAKYLFKQSQGSAKAASHAYDTYSKGLPDLNKKAQASTEGLQIINDPTQIGALGQARSLMLRAMGMNRYNDSEAAKSLPPSLYGTVKNMFQGAEGWSGSPEDAGKFGDVNPMNSLQKKAADSFFRGNLKNVQDQHDLLKKTAAGSYRMSGYYDPAVGQDFDNNVGKDFDNYINKSLAPKPGAIPINQQSPLPQQPQPSGPLDKLKSMFGMGAKPQPQAQQLMRVKHKATGQTGTIPAQEFDPNTYEQVQ